MLCPHNCFCKLHTEKVKFGAYCCHNFAHFCYVELMGWGVTVSFSFLQDK